MGYITCITPLVIAGIIFRIICRIANINSNKLLLIMILAAAAAEYIIFECIDQESLVFSYGFIAAIVYNLFKVRADTEDEENAADAEGISMTAR